MALREVLLASEPQLRQKAKKVRRFGPQLKRLADDMLETMYTASGVGLAGPQIGVMQRIFVAQIPEDENDPKSGKPYVIINPRITRFSPEMEEGQEGCLSIPGWLGLVDRHISIEVKAQNLRGKPIKFKLNGFLARVFQHEYDHLEGILFVDHIKDKEKLWKIEAPTEETEAMEKRPQAA